LRRLKRVGGRGFRRRTPAAASNGSAQKVRPTSVGKTTIVANGDMKSAESRVTNVSKPGVLGHDLRDG